MKKGKDGIVIGFDGKRAVQNMTGLGNYSRVVIGTLSALYPDNRYVIMAPRMCDNPRLEPLLMRENVSVYTPSGAISRRFTPLWRSASMVQDMAELGLDLFHGLSNELPLTASMAPCATVVTMHDLIWRRSPRDYKAVDRFMYEQKYRRSARLATRIIAVSECTKADLMADWSIPEEKIDVIYQGCDPMFSRPVDYDDRVRVRQTYKLPLRYIISVGTVQPRKNQMLAVKALPLLPDDVKLVIVGGGSAEYRAEINRYAEANGLTDRIVSLENVPFGDLPALYACAELSSYTSRYEGFGIPLVESLSVGTPAIACTGSCLREAAGEGAIYVRPDDVQGYAEAASAILAHAHVRDRLKAKGARHVARFTPTALAEATMQTYTKAILDFSLKQS